MQQEPVAARTSDTKESVYSFGVIRPSVTTSANFTATECVVRIGDSNYTFELLRELRQGVIRERWICKAFSKYNLKRRRGVASYRKFSIVGGREARSAAGYREFIEYGNQGRLLCKIRHYDDNLLEVYIIEDGEGMAPEDCLMALFSCRGRDFERHGVNALIGCKEAGVSD